VLSNNSLLDLNLLTDSVVLVVIQRWTERLSTAIGTDVEIMLTVDAMLVGTSPDAKGAYKGAHALLVGARGWVWIIILSAECWTLCFTSAVRVL
jgi:hypothetical protein